MRIPLVEDGGAQRGTLASTVEGPGHKGPTAADSARARGMYRLHPVGALLAPRRMDGTLGDGLGIDEILPKAQDALSGSRLAPARVLEAAS